MPVLPVIADPRHRAIRQANASGTLDVKKERVDGVVDPEQLQATLREGATLDLGTAGIGFELAVLDPSGDPLAAPGRAKEAELDHDEIGGALHQRRDEAPPAAPPACQRELLVA